MRDPYEILGIKRGATFDEIRGAYRRACKKAHPDMGGSHEAMVELNIAYGFILGELKHGYDTQRQSQPQQDGWRDVYKDIEDELDGLRRTAEQHETHLREMRRMAWDRGDRTAWLKLTWVDLVAFIRSVARSGMKGLALLFAALMGVGGALMEANLVSALIMIGAGLGLILSLALKSDKGGLMSAGLLLFGIVTLWVSPVRMALFTHPLATISVLLCLALIFKFVREGGVAGLATGGVLALYMIGVIVADTSKPQILGEAAPARVSPTAPRQRIPEAIKPAPERVPTEPQVSPPRPIAQPSASPPTPSPPEERTLIASDGAVLKFTAGVIYHVKVRTGFSTSISARQGQLALYSGNAITGECRAFMQFTPLFGAPPYQEINGTIRSCDGDTVVNVKSTRP